MAFTILVLGIIVAVYKLVELSLTRYERMKAMQRLEGQDLVEYLGKAAPQVDSLKASMWWLMRIGSLALGVGVGFIQSVWIDALPEGKFADTAELVLLGCMLVCAAIFLVIELFIERKLRK